MNILDLADHRPWPLPTRPWIMEQRWHDLLFAHWPISVEMLRSVVPIPLQVDTFYGTAWIGVVAFRLSGVRLRYLPEIGLLSQFPEVNLRTYVTYDGRPGVYFLSLDADNRLAIALARPWFQLNYYLSRIRFERRGARICFSSRRVDRRARPAWFGAMYAPCAPPRRWPHGSLEHWLTERYCYYSVTGKQVYRCEIHHPPWRLQAAQADIATNTLALSQEIELPATEPLLHYAHYMKAAIWGVRRCR